MSMTASKPAAVVESIGIDHLYEGQTGWVHALQDFCLTVPRNEFLCLVGPSGCGKSTFLQILSGMIEPFTGQVLINGAPVKGPGLDRGVVFQDPALFPWLTVIKNVEFGLKMAKWPAKVARERAMHVLEIVGLTGAAHLYPYQLSGGMKHRVAVARAWALKEAGLLLMDEPFSAIDAINRSALQDYLIETWLEEPRTVLYVTHDIDEAVYLADRVILLSRSPGRIFAEFMIEMPRPRDRNSAEAAQYRHRITDAMQESARRSGAS